VKDNDGATDTRTKTVKVTEQSNKSPKAVITSPSDRAQYKPGSSITFSEASSDSDGSITSYKWYFGDGSVSHSATAYHSYSSPGTYKVKLKVRDNDGATGTDRIKIRVIKSETKDVILSLRQRKVVHYGEWFPLKLDGCGTQGYVEIIPKYSVNNIHVQAITPYRIDVVNVPGGKGIEFWNGVSCDTRTQLTNVAEIKVSGNSENFLKLRNAEVTSPIYRINVQELIGTKIE